MDGTIVEYLTTSKTATKCGYCKKYDTSYTQGVWGYKMTAQDFQVLVDRGFQRSGNYVYRPIMKKTCCPQYVIRMDVKEFKLSKSHKSSIRKFKRFLKEGITSGVPPEGTSVDATPSEAASGASAKESMSKTTKKFKKEVRPGAGADPSKPPCKKAKVLRQERKDRKKQDTCQRSSTDDPCSTGEKHQASQEVSDFKVELKQLLGFPNDEGNAHTFETRLVPALQGNPDFEATLAESYSIFQKFQMGIHQENEEDCQMRHFKDFLIDSPLIQQKYSDSIYFGTFHYQYLVDDKIFAVGVLDILPKGIVCEYLYYNPEYRFITPGVISALLEISLTQHYFKLAASIQYYYMGYYVQSCPKMNYKSRYSASSLLCTETYTYVPLEKCIPVLKSTPYARLAGSDIEDANDTCSDEELEEVMLLIQGAGVMKYGMYKLLTGMSKDDLVREYVGVVSKELAITTMRAHIGALDEMLHLDDDDDDMSS